jgi:hypothetical protein
VKKIFGILKSPHIQIALSVGICIIVMAYFSKRVLSEPIAYLPLAIPPFIATIFEAVLKKYENSWISKTWYWIVLIFLSTFLVILFSALRPVNKPINVEIHLLPDGFRLPHDVSEHYEMHQQLFDSLLALNSDLQRENPSIRKLNKSEPQHYAPLNINGNTYTLQYESGQMDGMERVEAYKILLNGEKIYDFTSRAPVPIDHIHGFFAWQNNWILEHYKTILFNGVNINETYDYDASFFVSVVGDELFYFAQKNGRIYLVQNHQLTDNYYDEVIVYQCCDYSRYNPRFWNNLLRFYANKNEKVYFVNVYVQNFKG